MDADVRNTVIGSSATQTSQNGVGRSGGSAGVLPSGDEISVAEPAGAFEPVLILRLAVRFFKIPVAFVLLAAPGMERGPIFRRRLERRRHDDRIITWIIDLGIGLIAQDVDGPVHMEIGSLKAR